MYLGNSHGQVTEIQAVALHSYVYLEMVTLCPKAEKFNITQHIARPVVYTAQLSTYFRRRVFTLSHVYSTRDGDSRGLGTR